MGWTGLYKDPEESYKDFFTHEFGRNVVDVAVAKNVAYVAYRGANGGIHAIVVLLKRTTKEPDFNLMYKDMDEGMEPFYYDCPKKILKLLDPVEMTYPKGSAGYEGAMKWRKKCGMVVSERKAYRRNPFFIQRVVGEMKRKGTKGALHRSLRIPEGTRIPGTLLTAIISTPIGGIAKNPTKMGVKAIMVDRLLKERAVFANNMLEINR